MDASVLPQQDEEVLVYGGEWHSRPRNSMCWGSEAGRKCTFWKNGWKAKVLKYDSGVEVRLGWIMWVLEGGTFYL